MICIPNKRRQGSLLWESVFWLMGGFVVGTPGAEAYPKTFQKGIVQSVENGDTIWVKLPESGNRLVQVRLANIDAPEMGQYPWGELSRQALAARLPQGQEVMLNTRYVTPDPLHIAEVYTPKGLINLLMLKEGQAVLYGYHLPPSSDLSYYQAAQLGAQTARLNFWDQAQPEMPWDFRASQLSTSTYGSVPSAIPFWNRVVDAPLAPVGFGLLALLMVIGSASWMKQKMLKALPSVSLSRQECQRSLLHSLTLQKKLERLLDRAKQEEHRWQERLALALQQENLPLSETCLTQKNRHSQTINDLQSSLEEVTRDVTHWRESLIQAEQPVSHLTPPQT
ncbi:MAG: thermonuclease family protein [Cyanobacteriota bacterium]|nr:thermonuclease family protein [Cyanobacteriota bacterium]